MLGGGQLTCLVLLPIPRVPVAHERAGVVLIQVQLGQHGLPVGGGGTERERAHTSPHQEGRRGSEEAVPGPLARGSASWLSSHGRGLGPADQLADRF